MEVWFLVDVEDTASAFVWNCSKGVELAEECQEVFIHSPTDGYELESIVVDPLQDLVVSLFSSSCFWNLTSNNITRYSGRDFISTFASTINISFFSV